MTRLLVEADRCHFRELLSRGEYCIDPPHVRISCPECGGNNVIHQKAFNGRLSCRFCKVEQAVKLTGARAR